jgi:hypothetical protein
MITWTLITLACAVAAVASPDDPDKTAIARVLDSWHLAAAKADEAAFFGYFTPDAVYLGTDATERWTRDEFQKWAKPYFTKGKAWNFKAASRNVTLANDRKTAWFDEVLETPNLGPARGSGVLVRDGKDWKIAQYNLSVPIPNDVFADVKKRIDAHRAKGLSEKGVRTPRITGPDPFFQSRP